MKAKRTKNSDPKMEDLPEAPLAPDDAAQIKGGKSNASTKLLEACAPGQHVK
jgi:hypothetical protein